MECRSPMFHCFRFFSEMARRQFENTGIVPESVLDDNTAYENFNGRTIYHEDPSFPGVAPDMWISSCDQKPEYKQMDDHNKCRQMYLEQKKKEPHQNTFRMGCKHFVAGTGYKEIEGRFHVIETRPPNKLSNGKYKVFKHRVTVSVRGKDRIEKTVSVIEAALTPLVQVSQRNRQSFGKVLTENAKETNFEQNDCRKGQNKGSMVVTGTRCYRRELCAYANTTTVIDKLTKSAEEYLRKYGFGMWVDNLRKQCVEHHGNKNNMIGSKLPWCSMVVVSKNYGNEAHVDPRDSCQAITIWHEKKPPKEGTTFKNWYFLFPDLEVEVERGQWHTGVAIPLVEGTVITWDARMIRHCTAHSERTTEESEAWGTYFGNDQRAMSGLKRKHDETLQTKELDNRFMH